MLQEAQVNAGLNLKLIVQDANPMSRREIESRNPATSVGHIQLDQQDAFEVQIFIYTSPILKVRVSIGLKD